MTTIDRFGVNWLYNSKVGGQGWWYDADTLSTNTDPRVITEIPTTSMTREFDGYHTVKVHPPSDLENRFYITTSTGYNHSACSQDWATNLSRGYMQAANDWRNVEQTAYIRINSVYQVSGHSLVWYARSGRHSTSYPCEGSSYKTNIGYNLESRFQKESGHPYYDTTSWQTLPFQLQFGKWFGYKSVIYDIPGTNNVKLETWIDNGLITNNWVKVAEITDVSTWGISNPCGTATEKFLWGAPLVTYRFDSVQDIDFNSMSVREIQPPA